jgi:xanthine dehydrogenase YagR molybdenum-binding subunit
MNQVIGNATTRKEGRAKVTGKAAYTAEYQLPGLVHGFLITATIANGKIKSIDTNTAETAPGVIAIYTHKNAPKLLQPPQNDLVTTQLGESRLPLSNNQVNYGGQIIGLVVADSFERARHAASLVKVEYAVAKPIVDPGKAKYQVTPPVFGAEFDFQNGAFQTQDFATIAQGAAAVVDATYTTSVELHAAMEPHATVAQWQGNDQVTIYEPTQWLALSQRTYAALLGLPTEKVRIVSPLIGGAFGGKSYTWPHGALCAAAARELSRPLKIVLTRRQLTANAGHRSASIQQLKIAADQSGKIIAIDHFARTHTSPIDIFPETCIEPTPMMYATPSLKLKQEIAALNIGTPTWMRAPGEVPGLWSIESAMDELAWQLKIDPVELRLINQTSQHLQDGRPFSAKYFADCLKQGAKQFGWEQRPKQMGRRDRRNRLVGWGVAGTTFPGFRDAAGAKVRILRDGNVQVQTATGEIGVGVYTLAGMTAAETLGLSLDRIRVEIGDSQMPDANLAGSSQMSATLMPAVMMACQEALKRAGVDNVEAAFKKLRASDEEAFEGIAKTAPGPEYQKLAFNSWGAHFCELAIDEALGRLEINRWLSVINIGRVLNPKTATSQVRGAVIMAIGHALMEHCDFDPNVGHPVIYDMATYHIPCHADIPRIDVAFVGEPDTTFNPLGARGVGEIATGGVSAAIANAIYHATGKRLRQLPMTPDQLL